MSEESVTTKQQPDKRLIAAAIGLFFVGWAVGQSSPGGGLPWKPEKPRPVITAIARLAKFGLWLLVVDPPPGPPQYAKHDGTLNHREGW
jgi:hypothetical protein